MHQTRITSLYGDCNVLRADELCTLKTCAWVMPKECSACNPIPPADSLIHSFKLHNWWMHSKLFQNFDSQAKANSLHQQRNVNCLSSLPSSRYSATPGECWLSAIKVGTTKKKQPENIIDMIQVLLFKQSSAGWNRNHCDDDGNRIRGRGDL